LVSFGFFCRPNYQSIGCIKYLNLIFQGTWRSSFAALPYSDLAAMDLFVVGCDGLSPLTSGETLIPKNPETEISPNKTINVKLCDICFTVHH
jgi:hypothetical protein